MSAARPAASVALVAAGGTVGTALRFGLTLLVPPGLGVPVATLLANIAGAFLLGLLLEVLPALGPDRGLWRRLRLCLGTGVLGAFTTYSALAVETVALAAGRPGAAVAYGLGTVIVGGLAAVAGIILARRLVRVLVPRPRVERPRVDQQ